VFEKSYGFDGFVDCCCDCSPGFVPVGPAGGGVPLRSPEETTSDSCLPKLGDKKTWYTSITFFKE